MADDRYQRDGRRGRTPTLLDTEMVYTHEFSCKVVADQVTSCQNKEFLSRFGFQKLEHQLRRWDDPDFDEFV
jgi:hypothetical protein